MFKNNKNTYLLNNRILIFAKNIKYMYVKMKNFFHISIYSKYLFVNFAKDFLLWFFSFFLIIFAIKQMDVYEDNKTLIQNLIINLWRSTKILLDNINIISLLSCIFFIIRSAKNFNFYVLETFSITSTKIIKPIILFIIVINILKIFTLRPILIFLENKRTLEIERNIKNNVFLKKGVKFTIIQNQQNANNNDYMIISGEYNDHNSEEVKISNAFFLQYQGHKIIINYSTKNAVLKNNYWYLNNVNITHYNDKKAIQTVSKGIKLSTNLTPKEVAIKIKNIEKIKQDAKLNIYEHLKLIIKQHKTDIKNETDIKARVYIVNEILSLFTGILCCLLSFLYCSTSSRNSNIAKLSLKCFIIYFIILRFFRSMENVIKTSSLCSYCIIYISIALCALIYFFIINRDWCYKYSLKISEKLKKNIEIIKSHNYKLKIKKTF